MSDLSDSPLGQHLRHHAAQRGLWAETSLEPKQMFALVRDMAYARPSQPDPGTVIQEWRGTCSGKHSLLQALFAEAGLPSTVMACTQEIYPPAGLPVPPELQALLNSEPIYDVHNYLVVHSPQGETVVDATWPLHLKAIGLPANEHLVWGQAMTVACQPLETWAVPAGQRVEEHKAAVLQHMLTLHQRELRNTFITTVSRLLSPTSSR